MSPALVFITAVLALALIVLHARWRGAVRAEYIRTFVLPRGLFDKLREKYPSLTPKDCQLVAQALRHFFLAHLKSGRQFVAMPSQVADELWHEFILHTKAYAQFCNKAFGRFMHHTPAVVLGSSRPGNAGLRRCWWQVCREENINPRQATRLPLLFALDAKLGIPDGFRYALDCKRLGGGPKGAAGGSPYCAGDFTSNAIDGGTDGLGDSAAADASGDGGGDGGGCGGGCGGGGD